MREGQFAAPIIRGYLKGANRDKPNPFADHQLFCEMEHRRPGRCLGFFLGASLILRALRLLPLHRIHDRHVCGSNLWTRTPANPGSILFPKVAEPWRRTRALVRIQWSLFYTDWISLSPRASRHLGGQFTSRNHREMAGPALSASGAEPTRLAINTTKNVVAIRFRLSYNPQYLYDWRTNHQSYCQDVYP